MNHQQQPATAAVKKPIWPLLLVLFGLPLALIVLKLPAMPTAEFLNEHASLSGLTEKLQDKLSHILFVPLGAVLVVLVRLTLGLRVLGPFRSILLAVAFQTTGALMGMVFLAVTVLIVVAIRSPIGSLKLPYFGRITVMLSSVAVLMTLGVMAGSWFHLNVLQAIAYFPIIVLCLIADAFGRALKQEGIRSALFRGVMTALVGVLLAVFAGIPQIHNLFIWYPELLVAQIGLIVLISRRMNWRLLERFNPKVGEDEEDEYEKEWLKS